MLPITGWYWLGAGLILMSRLGGNEDGLDGPL